MGKQKWYRNKSFHVALLCIAAAITAVAGIMAQHMVNGKKKKK